METCGYTTERNAQILIALLKAHGIRRIVVSPGGTNIAFVGSVQSDDYFQLYSSVDERSAAYIACGLAEETGEPVALSCTGATASRNYMSGLTEAFYRKLPLLAITSSQPSINIGMLIPQAIDRRVVPNDIVVESVNVPMIRSEEDEWGCSVAINKAILALKRNGGGPSHINLVTDFGHDFAVRKLPFVQKIDRIGYEDAFPQIPSGIKVGVLVGAHSQWSQRLVDAVNAFCERYDAVVFHDLPGNYRGNYGVAYSLVCDRKHASLEGTEPDLLIHIGEMSGGYSLNRLGLATKRVWRVNPDGEIRDKFRKLEYVFEMTEVSFFEKYAHDDKSRGLSTASYFNRCMALYEKARAQIPDLPFSNMWIASQTATALPENSVLHLGILNSLRTWNYFPVTNSVRCYSNTGGFGIDGNTSSLIGASFADSERLYFGVVGDLSFFYDMNSLGNRHVGKNFRLLVVNNGRGTEFRLPISVGSVFGSDADKYIAAAGHYGQQSTNLVKHYAEDLGFEYITASDKKTFLEMLPEFLSSGCKPKVFEVFIDSADESKALMMVYGMGDTSGGQIARDAKSIVSNLLPEGFKKAIKGVLS